MGERVASGREREGRGEENRNWMRGEERGRKGKRESRRGKERKGEES